MNENLMTFGGALEKLKQGHCVARLAWNNKGMWLALSCDGARQVGASNLWSPANRDWANSQPNQTATVLPSITMTDAADCSIHMGWVASQADMLAEDWIRVTFAPQAATAAGRNESFTGLFEGETVEDRDARLACTRKVETRHYADGSSATGTAPLPDHPAPQEASGHNHAADKRRSQALLRMRPDLFDTCGNTPENGNFDREELTAILTQAVAIQRELIHKLREENRQQERLTEALHAKARRAEQTLSNAGFTDEGGMFWKPPGILFMSEVRRHG